MICNSVRAAGAAIAGEWNMESICNVCMSEDGSVALERDDEGGKPIASS